MNSEMIQGMMNNKDTFITQEIPRLLEALHQEPGK